MREVYHILVEYGDFIVLPRILESDSRVEILSADGPHSSLVILESKWEWVGMTGFCGYLSRSHHGGVCKVQRTSHPKVESARAVLR